jgi:hypothetical protein
MSYERGPQGIPGVTGATGTVYTPYGLWVFGTYYNPNAIAVSPLDYNTYVCLATDGTFTDPSLAPTFWSLFVQRGVTGSAPPVYQATYYKSVAQTLTSGSTEITFDLTGAWNNTGGYITHTSGSKDFNVVQTGLYQLEFNTLISANGSTWLTTSNKGIIIEITRSPTAEQSIIANSTLTASGQNYGQSVIATYYLEAGDVINLKINNTFAGGPASVLGLLNTFDLNTFFTWRFIS